MKNLSGTFLLLLLCLASCKSLTSTTYIKAADSFVLGNNEHGKFNARLKNISDHEIEVYRAPILGGTHSREVVKPNQSVQVAVEANTALVIDNKSSKNAAVELLIKGDVGLSMGYKNN
jgi:hypothetical protein